MLLFGGLLFAGTLRNLMTVDTGFDSQRVTVTRVDFSGMGLSPASRTATIASVLQRIRQLPEVASAAETRHVPLGGTGTTMEAWNESANGSAKTLVRVNATSPGYLKTMGITLIGGRDFDERDLKASPKVVIVNPAFTKKLGLGDNPVGQTFRSSASPGSSELYQIIGLTPDTKYSSLREDPVAIAFVPR